MEIGKEQKAAKIIRWRESLATMPDERFFEIMRIYAGEIHSPFNKDKLIEQLSSILRKEASKAQIISYLSEFDIKMLSAVSMISDADQKKLTDFFTPEYTLSQVYSEIINLNERLLIYSYKDRETDSISIQLNPLLEETLSPYLNIRRLFTQPECFSRNFDVQSSLSPEFIAAFISYVQENPGLCKNDISIKKKDLERIEQIFPGKTETFELLLNSFVNLGLLKNDEKELSFDDSRLEAFSSLSEPDQCAFLAAASSIHLSREQLKKQTQLVLDVSESIPETGFTKTQLVRAAWLISNKTGQEKTQLSRFSRILQEHSLSETSSSNQNGITDIFSSVIKALELFGLISVYGQTENGEKIYSKGEILLHNNYENGEHIHQTEKKGLLNINAGTSITLMPGLTLEELLPLISFLNIINSSTVTEFEITRKSVSRAFDKNISPEQIINLLEEYSAYEVPQNLRMNITDWQTSYSSAVLYKGYVLKVDEKSARVVEKNPKIAPYIQSELAPGIFLLNLQSDQDPAEFIQESGLEFMGNVKSPEKESGFSGFPILTKHENFLESCPDFDETEEIDNMKKAEETKKMLRQTLDSMQMTEQQRECLTNRIERNVILSAEQLRPNSVRLEILEADGMNYAGKIHLVETAIKNNDLIEITVPDEITGNFKTILGRPLMVSKHTNDAMVRLQIEENSDIRFYSISQANKIKTIKTSLFK